MSEFRKKAEKFGHFISCELWKGNVSKGLDIFHRMQPEVQGKNFSRIVNLIEKRFADGTIEDTGRLRWQIRFFKTIESDMLTRTSSEFISAEGKFVEFVNRLRLIDKKTEEEFVQNLKDQEHAIIKEQFDSVLNIIKTSLNLVMSTKKGADAQHKANNKTIEEKIDKALPDVHKIIDQVIERIEDKEKTDKLQNVFNQLAENFVKEAKKFKINANIFLGTALGFLLFIISGAIRVIYFLPVQGKTLDSDAYSVVDALLSGKLLLSIVLITSLVYSLRYYSVNSHNAVICHQRANTLKSL